MERGGGGGLEYVIFLKESKSKKNVGGGAGDLVSDFLLTI